MGSAVRLEIDNAAFDRMDRELASLEAIARMPVIKKSMKSAGDVVVKGTRERLPPPGYPGDKPGLRPLRETLKTKVVDYWQSGRIVAVVGFDWHRGGQHGHIVEEGHRVVTGGTAPSKPGKGKKVLRKSRSGERGTGTVRGFVEGRHYLAETAKATKSAQDSAVISGLEEAIRQARSQ